MTDKCIRALYIDILTRDAKFCIDEDKTLLVCIDDVYKLPVRDEFVLFIKALVI